MKVRSLVLPSFQDFCRDRDAVGREKSNGLFEQAIASCAEASGQLREALDHRKAPPSFAKVFIQRVLDSTEANMASYPNMMSEIQKHQKVRMWCTERMSHPFISDLLSIE